MPHQHAAQRKPILIHIQFADLLVHCRDHGTGGIGVVTRDEIHPAMFRVPQLEIRHVNVHEPVHKSNTLQAVIGGGIVDERHTQSMLHGYCQCLEDLGHNVFGRDKINVVATDRLEIEHHMRELDGRNLRAVAKLACLEVLTEHAAQIAPAEKDRARPVPSSQAILFSKMWERACHSGLPSALAHADLVVEPIDLAVSRADATRPQRFQGLLGALAKQPFLKRPHICRHKFLA